MMGGAAKMVVWHSKIRMARETRRSADLGSSPAHRGQHP